MNITIEARALSASMGIRTYVFELVRHLLPLSEETHYTLVYDSAKHTDTFPNTHEIIVPLHHSVLVKPWLEWQVPHALKNFKTDVIHYTKAAIPKKKIAPTVVTIYDIIPILLPQSQSLLKRFYWPMELAHAAQKSDHVITISEQSKLDIMHIFSLPEEKITVTPLAVDTTHFRPVDANTVKAVLHDKYRLNKPYILYVGTIEPRKNIPALARAVAALSKEFPYQLVIVGKKGPHADQVIVEAKEANLGNRLQFLGQIPYDDLPAIMSCAEVFVWPSVYEGWGLPPQEAMACGTPVIVSNGGSLPEVVGNAGEVVSFSQDSIPDRLHDIDFEQALSQKIKTVLTDSVKRQTMKTASLEHVKMFNWQKVAEDTLTVYKKFN